MKFTCDGLVLSDAAVTVSKACSTKTTTPILECIKISAKNDVLTMIAYDGEISIEKKIKAEVLEEGEICVNGRFFSDFIVKVSSMTVSVSTGEKGMEIRYGDSLSSMQSLPASDFPSIKTGEGNGEYFLVKESALKTLVSKTVFCCATDESRPILKGCLLETTDGSLYATALDGFRMAVSKTEIAGKNNDVKIVCPARTLTEISRMLENDDELKIVVEKNMLSVCLNDTVLTSRLYTGEFVKRENIFPSSFSTELYVSRAELIESVERASVLIRGDKNNLILFDIHGGNLLITANSEMGNVSECVKGTVSGKDLKIAMNGKFVLDALKALDEEEIKLSFNTSIAPFTIENKNDKTSVYLILPVRTTA